jgi:hypothetical protein
MTVGLKARKEPWTGFVKVDPEEKMSLDIGRPPA